MRMLMAIAFLCALTIGATQAASSGPTPRGGQLPTRRALPAGALKLEEASKSRCGGVPSCQRTSQCPADFCAGGAPLCFQGCCSCAS
jgi:hypothetical protein